MTASSSPDVVRQLDIAVYRLSAIKKAAYKFAELCYVSISTEGEHVAKVSLRCKKQGADIEALAADFENEVLDQELREVVLEETATVRELLMAHAFSATSLVDHDGETADYRIDPKGIRYQDGN